MLQLGGMENSSPNTNQSPNRFKLANNVTFTNQGQLTPRPSMSGFSGNNGPFGSLPFYRWDLFSYYINGSNPSQLLKWGTIGAAPKYKYLLRDDDVVPFHLNLTSADTATTNNFSCQDSEINNIKYILDAPNSSKSRLFKYDGFEVAPTGVGLPWIYPAPKNFSVDEQFVLKPTDTSGTWVKTIQHSMDMRGNVVSGNPITANFKTVNNDVGIGNPAQGIDNLGNKIIVGQVGLYSYDGINWDYNTWEVDKNSIGNGPVAYGVVSGVPTFVRLNSTAFGTISLVSNDGKFWQKYNTSLPFTDNWVSMAFGNGLFVAINNLGTLGTSIATSPDGITWTYRTSPISTVFNCIAYGGSGGNVGFVILCNTGTTCITSPDGITWTSRTIPSSQDWKSVVWGGSTWVAVASTGTTTTNLMTATNPFQAVGWTLRTSPAANAWNSVTAGLDEDGVMRFYAICTDNVSTNKLMTSTDPTVTWTGVNVTNAFSGGTVGYLSKQSGSTGTFVASANNIPMKTLYATKTTWTETNNPIAITLVLNASSASVNSFLTYVEAPSYFQNEWNFDPYFFGLMSYSVGNSRFEASVTNAGFNLSNNIYIIRLINFSKSINGRNRNISAIAYKVTNSSAPTLTFDRTIRVYDSSTLEWVDVDGSTIPEATGRFIATRTFYTVWSSPTATGAYSYKGVIPASPAMKDFSSDNFDYRCFINVAYPNQENKVQKASSLPFSIAGALNRWYDVTSFKLSFNEIFAQDPAISMTTYKGQLLVATAQTIYISDPTSGGSIEMVEGTSAVVIGGSEDGNITSICGDEDYLVVSRQRKVYLVSGDLVSGQYRTQDLPNITTGAYSNTCIVNIGGVFILLSSTGCWMIDGASAKPLSNLIPLNFRNFFKGYTSFHPSAEQDCLVFNMNNYPITAWNSPGTSKFITSCADKDRGLAVFTTSDTAKCGNSLVLHLGNGEWTTWNSYDADTYQVTAMTQFDGTIYVGTTNPAGNGGLGLARTAVEVTNPATYTYDYISRSAPRLITTWITVEEPSLEKLLLQLKLYGYFRTNVDIKHYANWNITTPITSAIYATPGNYVFFHKQRFNSSKQMSAAIEIQLRASGETFWLEGMEVEVDTIQVGMKR